jgi:glycosyltransferase involved in cell wall biosynthesis
MIKGDKIIAVSEFIKKYITDNYKVDNGKIKVVHRGVDINNQFNPEKISHSRVLNKYSNLNISKKVPTILMPGRFTSWKGHELLIDALSLIKDQEFECIFIGKTSKHPRYIERLKCKIKKNKLEDKIKIKDPVNDMPAIYLASDIVISASTRPEAFGRISTEAQAMGRIFIATDHGGSSETVIDNVTGFLVENKNADQLAKKIQYVLNLTESEKNEISINAMNHIKENFSLEKMINDTIEVYESLLI